MKAAGSGLTRDPKIAARTADTNKKRRDALEENKKMVENGHIKTFVYVYRRFKK